MQWVRRNCLGLYERAGSRGYGTCTYIRENVTILGTTRTAQCRSLLLPKAECEELGRGADCGLQLVVLCTNDFSSYACWQKKYYTLTCDIIMGHSPLSQSCSAIHLFGCVVGYRKSMAVWTNGVNMMSLDYSRGIPFGIPSHARTRDGTTTLLLQLAARHPAHVHIHICIQTTHIRQFMWYLFCCIKHLPM